MLKMLCLYTENWVSHSVVLDVNCKSYILACIVVQNSVLKSQTMFKLMGKLNVDIYLAKKKEYQYAKRNKFGNFLAIKSFVFLLSGCKENSCFYDNLMIPTRYNMIEKWDNLECKNKFRLEKQFPFTWKFQDRMILGSVNRYFLEKSSQNRFDCEATELFTFLSSDGQGFIYCKQKTESTYI